MSMSQLDTSYSNHKTYLISMRSFIKAQIDKLIKHLQDEESYYKLLLTIYNYSIFKCLSMYLFMEVWNVYKLFIISMINNNMIPCNYFDCNFYIYVLM